jgi:hypothetical protein
MARHDTPDAPDAPHACSPRKKEKFRDRRFVEQGIQRGVLFAA